jgi:hypothetical protein
MPIQIWDGSSWLTAADPQVYNGTSWVGVNFGYIWDGSDWQIFYSRIAVQAPTVTAAITTTSITWTVTQATEAQFAEFPSTLEYFLIFPNGTRVPSSGVSTSSSRIVTIAMTGIFQNQSGELRYRLNYGSGVFFPTSGAFIVDNRTTTAIPLETATVQLTARTATSLTFSIDRKQADTYSFELTRGTNIIYSGTGQQDTQKIFPNLDQNTTYVLTVTSRYTTARPVAETITAPEVSGTTEAVAVQFPSITFISSGFDSLNYSVNIFNADRFNFELRRASNNVLITSGTGLTPSPGTTTRSLSFGTQPAYTLYQNTGYYLVVTSIYDTGFTPDVTRTTSDAFRFTAAVNTSNPGITLTQATLGTLSFSIDLRGAQYYRYQLYQGATPITSEVDFVTNTSLSFTGLASSTTYTLYIRSAYTTYFEFTEFRFNNLSATTATPQPPPAPTISNLSRTYRTLTWSVSSSGFPYQYQIGTFAGGSNVASGSNGASANLSVTGLPPSNTGTLYYARVRSVDQGTGLVSDWVSISRSTLAVVNPSITSATTATTPGGKIFTVNYTLGSGFSLVWRLYRTSNNTLISSGTDSDGTVLITGLLANTQYRFYYRAIVSDTPNFSAPLFVDPNDFTTWPSVTRTTPA